MVTTMVMATVPKMPKNNPADRLKFARPGVSRVVVVVAAFASIMAFAISTSIASIARYNDPELALRVAPWDSVANAVLADQRLQSGQYNERTSAFVDPARSALTRSPLSPAAFRVLGFADDLRGQPARAKRAVMTAERLSRRDLGTQLWLINEAVARADATGALRHFDTAMRTSVVARTVLFPVLTQAIQDQELRPGIAAMMRSRPNWLRDFTIVAVQTGSATVVAKILPTLNGALGAETIAVTQATIDQLVREGQYGIAKELSGHRAQTAQAITSSDFKRTRAFPPFAWVLAEEDGISAQPSTNGLILSADRGRSGTAAAQVLALRAGTYRLQTRGAVFKGGTASWSLRCLPSNVSPVVQLAVPSERAASASSAAFSIPSKGCAGQSLRLDVDALESQRGLTGKVDRVVLERQMR